MDLKLMMEIEFSDSPSPKDVMFLNQKINEETPEYGAAYPFGFFIRADDGKPIAGANGFVIYGKIHTDQLWVSPEFRKQGLACQLMEKIHQFGIKEGCIMASISTMNFQNAVGFYEKLGYQVDFERKGHTKGSSCFFMSKIL